MAGRAGSAHAGNTRMSIHGCPYHREGPCLLSTALTGRSLFSSVQPRSGRRGLGKGLCHHREPAWLLISGLPLGHIPLPSGEKKGCSETLVGYMLPATSQLI